MGDLARLYAETDNPPVPPADDDDYWYSPDRSDRSQIYGNASPDAAMRLAVVNACVRKIAETLASPPLETYRRLDNGAKRRATDISLYDVLHDTPNDNQSSFEFREMLTGHYLLRGNGYAEVLSDERGAVRQLIPIHPDRVEVETIKVGRETRRRYKVQEGNGERRTILQDDMFHLRAMSLDGVTGVGVIEWARETIARAQAQNEHGRGLFEHGANPGGVLEHPMELSEPAAKRLENKFNREWGGSRRTGGTMVLEEGMTWKQVGLSSVDADWLNAINATDADIARFFGMILGMIQLGPESADREQLEGEFLTYTMLPHFRRWEGTIRRDLVIAPKLYFVEFNMNGFARGKRRERMEGYRIGREIGMFTPNDLLAFENMNPREDPGGDEYIVPMNMNSSGDKDPLNGAPTKAAPPGTDPGQQQPARRKKTPPPVAVPAKRAASDRARLFAAELAGQMLRREVQAGRNDAVKYAASPERWRKAVRDFYGAHAGQVATVCHLPTAVADAYARGQAEALIAGGVIALETWEADHVEALTKLMLDHEEGDSDAS